MKENSNIEDRIEKKYIKYLNRKTNILELTIEEAIFILEGETDYADDIIRRAYKVILSDYKRVLKENELAKKALIKNCNIADERNQLLKENEKLKDKYATFVKMSSEVISNSIPIQKVKDKIEFLKEEGYWLFTIDRDSDKCVELLQELIEKEK